MDHVRIRLNPFSIVCMIILCSFFLLYLFSDVVFVNSDRKVNLKELLSVSLYLSRQAGGRVREIKYNNNLEAKSKGDTKEGAKQYVTMGDMESHKIIYGGLTKAFPGLLIISEEHGNQPFDLSQVIPPDKHLAEIKSLASNENVKLKDATIWIDPLDATQEYSETDPSLLKFVTVMICVSVKGEPIIGIIHKPFEDISYWSWVGVGHSKSLDELSENVFPHENDRLKVIISRSHHGDVQKSLNETLGSDINVTIAGGAGYKSLEVLAGRQDAYIHTTVIKKWDICAPNAILRSYGHRMTDLMGTGIRYGYNDGPVNRGGILAARSKYDSILKNVKSLSGGVLKHNQ